MRTALRSLAAVALLAAALPATSGTAATLPSSTYLDKTGGYEITLPKAWRLIPRSETEIRSLIAELKRTKSDENAALAETYSAILASPTGLSGLSAYRFQAFAWPPDLATPILTEVSVGIVGDAKSYGRANLAALGDEYASALARNSGARIASPRRVQLPAGAAEFLEGTIPAGGGYVNGVELYLIPHGLHIYELTFQVDASLLAKATLFGAIAQAFRFA